MADLANEVPHSMSLEGETTGEKWFGEFRFKRLLGHNEQLRKDQIRRELLGPQIGVPGERALSTSMILADLSVRLVAWPKWWPEVDFGRTLKDDNVLGDLWDKVQEIEAKVDAERAARAEKAQKQLRDEAAAKAKAEAAEAKEMG